MQEIIKFNEKNLKQIADNMEQKKHYFEKEDSDMNTTNNINTVNQQECTAITFAKNEEVEKINEGQVSENVAVVQEHMAILEVPDDEQAVVVTQEIESKKKVRELGVFLPTNGMANISHVLQNKLYAKIYVDKDGKRFIHYIQKYANNSYSPVMSIAQSDMIIAGKFQFSYSQATESIIKNKIKRFFINAYDDYAGKFRGMPEEDLEFLEVLKALMAAMPNLPVCSEEIDEFENERFYWKIIDIIKSELLTLLDDHKSYYTLLDEHIIEIARRMGMKKRDLLNKMKENGFLYLTNSSKGFQTNVRFKGGEKTYTEWCYCIYKYNFFAGVEDFEEQETLTDF